MKEKIVKSIAHFLMENSFAIFVGGTVILKIFAPLVIVALLLIHFKKWILALIVCLFTLLISMIWWPSMIISMPLMGYYIYKRKKQNKLDEEQAIMREEDRKHRENIRYIAEKMRKEEVHADSEKIQ